MSSRVTVNDGFSFSAVIRGLGTALLWELGLSILLGVTYYFASMSDGLMSTLLVSTNAVALLVGGLHAAKSAGNQGWLHGCATGITYIASLWALQAMGFVPSEALATGAILLAAVGSLLAGGIGGMIGMATAD